MEKNWRIIVHPKCNGYYNMAVDEAMVDFYHKTKIPILRIYGWDQPFVSLGYNQAAGDVLVDDRCDFTRRMTGGSAILHQDEVTYSLVCSREDLSIIGSVKESYKKLCSFLINFYAALGLKALFACDLNLAGLGSYKDICFLSYEHYDILVNGKKLGGNAQKRGRDFIFQHGSIPLSIDMSLSQKWLKNSLGIEGKALFLNALLLEDVTFNILQNKLSESFCATFNIAAHESQLADNESVYCKELARNKYLTYEWKHKA